MTVTPRDARAARVLVIDDEPVMLDSCRHVLERHGLGVDTEADPFVGRERALAGEYDLILLDMRLPDLDGLDILASVREHRSDIEVIIMTGYATVETAVRAVKLGAFDYVAKPFTPDELRSRVNCALEYLAERRAAAQPPGPAPRMVGDSDTMRSVHLLIARVASTDASVLIVGESGTGKELAAQEIHTQSARRDKPLVSLDCSALAPGLLESELFGHVKGSFTGAVATKPGLFDIAHHGTLVLDEVASLSLETQGKLLRVLETGEVKPVGGVEVRTVDIRLVAATNRDLAELVRAQTFREDLFYRLNVVPIRLPPLRERPGDVPQLLAHFLGRFRKPNASGPSRFSPDALQALAQHSWPGNVRELRNLVERLVVTTEGDTIRLEHLPGYILKRAGEHAPRVPRTNEELKAMKRSVRMRLCHDLERSFVIEALRRNNWNVTRAAQETGLLRPNFHALMRKHRVRVEET